MFDGDGRTDLLRPSAAGLQVGHALGGGRYRVTVSAPIAQPGGIEWYYLVELDGDGDLDLVTAHETALRSYLNDGTGAFTLQNNFFAAAPRGDGARIGDVDGDGDADIMRTTNFGVELYRNDGGSLLAGVLVAPIGSNPTAAFTHELADLDGDGDLDLLTNFRDGSGALIVLANDGTGSFTATTAWTIFPASGSPGSMRAGDVDNDGDIDLMMSRLGLELHLNDGLGNFVFSNQTNLPAATVSVGVSFLLEDLDDDGDLDFLSSSGAGSTVYLVNDGTGHFVDSTSSRWAGPLPFGSFALSAQDVDDDGDLEVLGGGGAFFTGSPAGQSVAINHGRQCVSRRLIESGGLAEIDSFTAAETGSPGFTLLLVALGKTAPVSVPGIGGTLQLNGPTTVVLSVAPASGAAPSRTFLPIAASPVFHGLPLFFQQLHAPQVGNAGFSNLVEERVVPAR